MLAVGRQSRGRRAPALVLAVSGLLILSACSQGTGVAEESAASGWEAPAALVESLESSRAVPGWEAPGPAFDAMSAAQGRKLVIIPANSSIPFVQEIAREMTRIGRALGLEVTVLQNQGQTSQWVEAIGTALSLGADSIDLLAGIDPSLVGPQAEAAMESGVHVVATHFYDVDQDREDDLSAYVDAPYRRGGELMAEYAINSSRGQLNAVVATIDQVKSTVPLVQGIEAKIEEFCPDTCQIRRVNSNLTDVATSIPNQVRGALQADPGINTAIALYDSAQAPHVINGIQSAGRAGDVDVVTFNGTPSMLTLIEDGQILADVGENLEWIAYAAIDQHLRLYAGLEPLKDPGLLLRVWDKENLGEAGDPPQNSTGYGDAYIEGYREMWQLPASVDLEG